jgi:hypothetical protein
MVGPDGQELAVWENDARFILGIRSMLPPSSVILGRMNNPQSSSEDRFFVYGGQGLRLYPIRWSTTGDRLYIRVREPQQRIIAINASGNRLGEAALASEWKLTDIMAIKHGDVRALSAPSILEKIGKIDGKELIRGSATLGSTVELLGARGNDLKLVRFASGRWLRTGINSGHTRLLTAFTDDRDYPLGVAYLGAASGTDGDTYLPYQLPIVDLETGRIAGRFGPLQIQLKDPAHLQDGVEQLNRSLSNDGGIILDVSLSGHALVALVVHYGGRKKLVRIGGQGTSEKLICSRPAGATNANLRIFGLDQRGQETMQPGRPILVRYSADGGRPRDAVLDFHGGPGGSLADNTYWLPPSLKLLRSDRDIIAVEYAGSVGGSTLLTRRLGERGMDALRQDVDAIAMWLSKHKYRRIYVFAGSFGSVPAMLLQYRHPNLVSASFHTGPVLKVVDPREWANRGNGLHPTNPDTQLAYELASYGGLKGRTKFAKELRKVLREAKLDPNYHFYFGGFDDISKPAHLPLNSRAKVVVIQNASHAELGARAEVWRDIENNMK